VAIRTRAPAGISTPCLLTEIPRSVANSLCARSLASRGATSLVQRSRLSFRAWSEMTSSAYTTDEHALELHGPAVVSQVVTSFRLGGPIREFRALEASTPPGLDADGAVDGRARGPAGAEPVGQSPFKMWRRGACVQRLRVPLSASSSTTSERLVRRKS